MKIRHLQLPLALALALGAAPAHALGLGALEVKSGLNQPLVAEIPILSAAPGELEELEVRLASPEAFARVGLERPVGLTANLQMEVGRNAQGQPVIRVTTSNRFNEPFLTFLIEANWGRGSVVREYSALVDPPHIAPAVIRPLETPAVAAAPVVSAPAPMPPAAPAEPVAVPEAPATEVAEIAPEPMPEPVPEPVAALPEPEPEPMAAVPEPLPEPLPEPAPPVPEPVPEPEPEPEPIPEPIPEPEPEIAAEPEPAPPPPVPAPAPAPADPGQYGPVADGQTLWSIASSTRPDPAVTVNQMMLALQRANPEAFIDDNINQLKRGAVLRIPASDEALSLGAAEAAQLVRAQAEAWQSRRRPVPQPAESVADSRPAPTPAAPTSAPPAQGRLEIVPPTGDAQSARGVQSGAASGESGAELRAELTEAKEDLAARQAEIQELRSHIAELEAQQGDSQRLIEMQSSQLKALQERLAAAEGTPPGDAGTVASAPAPDTTEPAPAPSQEPAPAADAARAEAPAATPWYLNPLVLGGAGLVLLGGLVLGLRGKRKPAPLPSPPRRISDDDALKASLPGARGQAAGDKASADAAAVTAASAVAPAAVPEDAERAQLEAAVEAEPTDLEAHISLLRHLHKLRDRAGYESAAQAMRLQVRSTLDPRWREAVVMGVALSPANPLFSQAGWNTPRFGDTGVMPASAAQPSSPSAPPPAPPAAPDPTDGEDLSDLSALAAAPAGNPDASDEDWDSLGLVDSPDAGSEPESPAQDTQDAAPEPAQAFDLVDTEAGFDASDEAFQPSAGTSGDDAVAAQEAVSADDDASATKIELAKAYLEIGDVDGARGMLEEVVAEGSPAVRADAERLLREIG